MSAPGILDRIDAYRTVLESYSRRLLPFIHWQSTDRGNVTVLNQTADFYRYFDATPHAEFLFECVPDRLLDLLFRFLRQNEGQLSKRAREKEFSALSDSEAARIETIYAEIQQAAAEDSYALS